MSIRLKLTAGFGVVLALMVVLGLTAWTRIDAIKSTTDELGRDVVPSTSVIGSLKDQSGAYRRNQLKYLLSEPADRKAALEDVQQNAANVRALVSRYRRGLVSSPADRRGLQGFTTNFAAYVEHAAPALELAAAGRTAEAYKTLDAGAADDDWEAVKATLAAWDATVTKGSAASIAEADDTVASTQRALAIVLILALLVGVGLAATLTRSLTGGLRRLVAGAQGIADGDVDQHVELRSRDELGEAGAAFEQMVAYLQETASVADRIAAGDLSQDPQPRSERDRLGVALAAMSRSLRDALTGVSGSAAAVSAASQQIAASSSEVGRASTEVAGAIGQIAEGTERQAASVADARRTAADMAAGIDAASRSAAETARAAEAAGEAARGGVGAADRVSDAMASVREASRDVNAAVSDLGRKSEQIGGIVETIGGIAEQTNLLALNAAIEAARAGDQGRGFAVVADEVRKLAEESQAATATISALIAEIQTGTRDAVALVEDGARRSEAGVETVEETRQAFRLIGDSVQDVTARVSEIADAAQALSGGASALQESIGEVAALAESASASTEQVSASTEETSASTQQVAASAQELARTAEELAILTSRFQLQ